MLSKSSFLALLMELSFSTAGGEAELEYLENCKGSVTRPLTSAQRELSKKCKSRGDESIVNKICCIFIARQHVDARY